MRVKSTSQPSVAKPDDDEPARTRRDVGKCCFMLRSIFSHHILFFLAVCSLSFTDSNFWIISWDKFSREPIANILPQVSNEDEAVSEKLQENPKGRGTGTGKDGQADKQGGRGCWLNWKRLLACAKWPLLPAAVRGRPEQIINFSHVVIVHGSWWTHSYVLLSKVIALTFSLPSPSEGGGGSRLALVAPRPSPSYFSLATLTTGLPDGRNRHGHSTQTEIDWKSLKPKEPQMISLVENGCQYLGNCMRTYPSPNPTCYYFKIIN